VAKAKAKSNTHARVRHGHAETLLRSYETLPLALRMRALCLRGPSLWSVEAKFVGSGALEASVRRFGEKFDDLKLRRGRRPTYSDPRIIAIAKDLLRSTVNSTQEIFFDRVGGELERVGIVPIPGRTWMRKHLGPIYKAGPN
jgi:hypothetical protein